VKHILSLGAGVQSSTLALMAAKGLVSPLPDAAIFADTQAEPPSVYLWLDWLEKQLPFPVYRVTEAKRLDEEELVVRRSKKSGKLYRRSLIPAFGRNLLTEKKAGIFPRKCTRDFKLTPIFRKAKELGGVPRQKRSGIYVSQWIGISTDEAHRMKPSGEAWAENRWPLIELGMSREDCLRWMADQGYPQPPRSACVFCPFHNDHEWARLKREEPDQFARAVAFEQAIQVSARRDEVATSLPYLHDSRQPLDEVVFDEESTQPNKFGNECEGFCGN
jgi:hypothetical protein